MIRNTEAIDRVPTHGNPAKPERLPGSRSQKYKTGEKFAQVTIFAAALILAPVFVLAILGDFA